MASGFSDISNAIKTLYSSAKMELYVNDEAKFRASLNRELPSGAVWTKGGTLKFGGATSGMYNIANIADAAQFPTNNNDVPVQFTLNPIMFAGGFSIGAGVLAAVNTSTSGFNGGELNRRIQQHLSNAAWFIDSSYVGTHGTGRRARVSADGGANEIVMALPEGVGLLREGLTFTERTTDGGASVTDSIDNRRISKIVESTRTITYSGADQTPVAGDHIHPVAGATQTITSIYPNGLRGLVDDGTFLAAVHGLTRSTYGTKLYAQVSSNGGTLRNLTEQLLIGLSNKIYRASGKRPTACWANQGQAAKWVEFLAADRRNVVSPDQGIQNLKMGYGEGDLVFHYPGGTFALKTNINVVPREVYLLTMENFIHYVAREYDWWTDTAGSMLKPGIGTAGYVASFDAQAYSFENFGCNNFVAQGVLRDLRDPDIGD